MASIFKALDGGHLDRALFRSRPRQANRDRRDEKVVQTHMSRGSRLFRRSENASEGRHLKTDTDPDR